MPWWNSDFISPTTTGRITLRRINLLKIVTDLSNCQDCECIENNSLSISLPDSSISQRFKFETETGILSDKETEAPVVQSVDNDVLLTTEKLNVTQKVQQVEDNGYKTLFGETESETDIAVQTDHVKLEIQEISEECKENCIIVLNDERNARQTESLKAKEPEKCDNNERCRYNTRAKTKGEKKGNAVTCSDNQAVIKKKQMATRGKGKQLSSENSEKVLEKCSSTSRPESRAKTTEESKRSSVAHKDSQVAMRKNQIATRVKGKQQASENSEKILENCRRTSRPESWANAKEENKENLVANGDNQALIRKNQKAARAKGKQLPLENSQKVLETNSSKPTSRPESECPVLRRQTRARARKLKTTGTEIKKSDSFDHKVRATKNGFDSDMTKEEAMVCAEGHCYQSKLITEKTVSRKMLRSCKVIQKDIKPTSTSILSSFCNHCNEELCCCSIKSRKLLSSKSKETSRNFKAETVFVKDTLQPSGKKVLRTEARPNLALVCAKGMQTRQSMREMPGQTRMLRGKDCAKNNQTDDKIYNTCSGNSVDQRKAEVLRRAPVKTLCSVRSIPIETSHTKSKSVHSKQIGVKNMVAESLCETDESIQSIKSDKCVSPQVLIEDVQAQACGSRANCIVSTSTAVEPGLQSKRVVAKQSQAMGRVLRERKKCSNSEHIPAGNGCLGAGKVEKAKTLVQSKTVKIKQSENGTSKTKMKQTGKVGSKATIKEGTALAFKTEKNGRNPGNPGESIPEKCLTDWSNTADQKGLHDTGGVEESHMCVGAHCSIAGGVSNAVKEARSLGAKAFALFVRNGRTWKLNPLDETEAERFKVACKELGYPPNLILPHGSYLLNCGSSNPDTLKKSRETLVHELQICERLGLSLYNFHPGSACGQGTVDQCIQTIAQSINLAHGKTKFVKTVIENMSCQGQTVGGKFEELRAIIDQVSDKSRVGVCLDTCHAFAAGFDLSTEQGFQKMMSDFEEKIGLQYLSAVHLNDSKGELGCHLDRHENIGKGRIGLDGFKRVMKDPRFRSIPMILETPPGDYAKEIRTLYQLAEVKSE